MIWHSIRNTALALVASEGLCFAQAQPLCIPGTTLCAGTNGNAGVHAGGNVAGQVGPNGASTSSNGSMGANANGQASVDANGHANVDANGQVSEQEQADYSPRRTRRYSQPIRFGSGLAFCATAKAGVSSGYKLGPCFAVSFRTEPLMFELESQLLFGGTRHSIDWVFPMSFVIPLTTQHSLYEGLQLRVGGSPIGVTFAKSNNGGTYLRFGVHAGLSYEYGLGAAASWRVFDLRTFLDFGTRREVDTRNNFMDFGGQLSTGIVF